MAGGVETADLRPLLLAFAGLFGLLLGSFLNALIFRLPRNCMSIARGRSRCPKCRETIAWFDNLPVLSWLLLRGRCRRCAAPISARYPAVELLTGVAVAWLAWGRLWPDGLAGRLQSWPAVAPGWESAVLFGAQLWLVASLIAATFIDIDFKILPDEINWTGLGLGLAACAIWPWVHLGGPMRMGWPFGDDPFMLASKAGPNAAGFLTALWGAVIGAGITYVIRVFGQAVFKREAMGLGDVKLMAFLGAWLGWRAALILFVLGSFYGTLYALAQFPLTRKLRGVEIWFGPFLALGALTMILAGGVVDRAFEAYVAAIRAR